MLISSKAMSSTFLVNGYQQANYCQFRGKKIFLADVGENGSILFFNVVDIIYGSQFPEITLGAKGLKYIRTKGETGFLFYLALSPSYTLAKK